MGSASPTEGCRPGEEDDVVGAEPTRYLPAIGTESTGQCETGQGVVDLLFRRAAVGEVHRRTVKGGMGHAPWCATLHRR